MKLFLKNKRGLTLIEMLLYVSISSTMLVALVGALSVVLESRVRNNVSAEVDQQGLQVMQMITQTLRNADSVNSPTSGTSAASVSVKTFLTNTDPTIFSESGGVLYITEGTSTPIALTNSHVTVSELLFQNLSRTGTSGIIRISFKIDYSSDSTKNEYVYSKNFVSSVTIR